MSTKFFLFHKEEVGQSSVTESDTGVGISIFAVPASSISHISASYGYVRIVFNDAGLYDFTDNNENEAIKKTTVDVDCVYGEESKLIEDILNFINSSNSSVMKFDFVKGNGGFRSARKDGTITVKVRTSPDQFTVKSIEYKALGATSSVSVIDGVSFAANQYPVVDYNPTGITGYSGATSTLGYAPNWINSSSLGGSDYDCSSYYVPTSKAYAEFNTGKTVTGLGATSIAVWSDISGPKLLNKLEINNSFTFYYVVGLPAKSSSTVVPGPTGLQSWELNLERISSVCHSGSEIVGFSSNVTSSTFSVKTSSSNSSASSFTNNTNSGTVSYSFPDKSSLDSRQTCYVFVVRRDSSNNLYLHNHNGDTVGFIASNTSESEYSGRTDGSISMSYIGSFSGFRGYICRLGVIETDIGSSEASRIAQELYNRYKP